MRRSFPPASSGLFVAAGLALLGALADLPRSPAHEAQLFFADHALRDFWGRFDARWYGGVDVTLVPSLVPRLTALVARLPWLGLERAYALVLAWAGAAFGLGVARLGTALTPPTSAAPQSAFVLGAVSAPLVWIALVPAGEPGVVLALALALNAAAFTFDGARPLELVASAGLAAAAAAAHPIGLVALAALAPTWVRRGLAPVSVLLGAGLGAVALGQALASSATLVPRLTVPPWATWAVVASAALALVTAALRRRAAVALLAAASVLVALAAPWAPRHLPALALLAVALTLALVALAAVDPLPGWAGLGAAALVFVVTATTLGWYRSADTRARRAALRELEWALANVPEGERYRFVTVGLGPEWIELSRRVRPGSIDGALEGALPTLDRLELPDPAASRALRERLEAPAAAVRWVVTGRPGAEPLLEPLGFTAVSAWRGNVTLWERASTAPLGEQPHARVRAPWHATTLTPLLGLASVALLGLALVRLQRATPAL